MRKSIGGFLLCVLINLAFDWWGILPSLILLVLHYWLHIPFMLAIIALLLWIFAVVLRTAIITFAANTGESAYVQRPNKNPYSKKTSDFIGNSDEKQLENRTDK